MQPNVVNNFVKVSQEHNHIVVKNAGGLQGIPGPAGAGLQIDGSVATYAELPQHLRPEDAGVAYFVQADGKLYVWSGSGWPADGEGSQFEGPAGQDGYSPTATVTKVGNTATITIRDKDGTTTASISDGTIPVIDDHLDLTSENPVENKVVTQAINQKQDILQNGSITTSLVADEAITSAKIATGGVATTNLANNAVTAAKADWTSFISKIYPVGSIYSSTSNTSPASFIGGTWQEITDYELVAYVNTNGNEGQTIVRSKNVSSVTLQYTGTYLVTLSKNMDSTDYIVLASAEASGTGSEIIGTYERGLNTFKVDISDHTGAAVNPWNWNIAVFGRLASPEKYTWKRTA